MNKIVAALDLRSSSNEDRAQPVHRITFLNLLWTILGITAISVTIYQFNLESEIGLIRIMPIVLVGFFIHAIAPLEWRPPLFFGLTTIGLVSILGWWDGGILIFLGLSLFSLANLQVQNTIKYTLIIIFVVFLAVSRVGWVSWFDKPEVITILGALFMFRLMVYLYEIRLGDKNKNIWQKLNYFFLLPNLIFFIFPVVDYKTFTQKYYDQEAFKTYQKGIVWMANGILHLFLYRIIYYFIIPSPLEVSDPLGLLYFTGSSYALVVRLAGIFHFSAGVLCLFGYNLPPTFFHYFFAPNFNELWRRINIYWRDFMVKVFYFPIYFRLKHLGIINAIVLSILIVFVINWFLHGYQWFWIRGTFPLTIQDAVFWSIFGIGVAINSALSAKKSTKNKSNSESPGFTLQKSFLHACSVFGVFAFMSMTWSFWITEDIGAWQSMVLSAMDSGLSSYIVFTISIVLIIAFGMGLQWLLHALSRRQLNPFEMTHSARFMPVMLILFSVIFLSLPFNIEKIEDHFAFEMDPVLHTRLNKTDRERQFKGYYETLLPSPQLMDTPLEQLQRKRPDDWQNLHALDAMNTEDNILMYSIRPNLDITFKRSSFRTNSYGLRGPEISLIPKENTNRIALMGGSIELGGGVPYEETFSQIWQQGLNEHHNESTSFEVVNFAVTGYHLPEQVYLMKHKVMAFKPNVIVYTAHSNEKLRTLRGLYQIFLAGYHLEEEFIRDLILRADIEPNIDRRIFEQKLLPFADELIEWGLKIIYEIGQRQNAEMLWIYVPSGMDNSVPGEKEELMKLAKKIGFHIIDLQPYYNTMQETELMLAPWDNHLSLKAHQVYGKGLTKESLKIEGLFNSPNGLND